MLQENNLNVTYNNFIYLEALSMIEVKMIALTKKYLLDFVINRVRRTG